MLVTLESFHYFSLLLSRLDRVLLLSYRRKRKAASFQLTLFCVVSLNSLRLIPHVYPILFPSVSSTLVVSLVLQTEIGDVNKVASCRLLACPPG